MKEQTYVASVDSIPLVTSFVVDWLESLDCPMRVQTQIDLSIDEIFTNIASYAYGSGTGDATVQLDFDEASRTVSITFVDSGIAYNPLEKPDPDVTLPAEEREIGGLGIYLVKKVMDGLNYKRENGLNILTLYKKI